MDNYESIINRLRQYTADELFYKGYHEAHASPERLRGFLARQDAGDIIRRRLICPELNPTMRSVLPEQIFFSAETGRNIWIAKHNRYVPTYIHQHEYFELVYVLEGSCTHRIDGGGTVLPQGTLCFVAPYTDHDIDIFDDSIVLLIMIQRTTFDDIFFNVLRNQSVLSDFFLSNLYARSKITHLTFQMDDRELVELLLSMLQEEEAEDSFSHRILNSMMSLFFVKLMRRCEDSALTHFSGEDTGKQGLDIVRFINDHYKSVTLKQVAEHFGYSLEHCSRLTKAVTGQNFTQLLRNIRMRRAETLLVTTPSSIENISLMVGYENPTTFIKLFKQQHGMTPGDFRRANQREVV